MSHLLVTPTEGLGRKHWAPIPERLMAAGEKMKIPGLTMKVALLSRRSLMQLHFWVHQKKKLHPAICILSFADVQGCCLDGAKGADGCKRCRVQAEYKGALEQFPDLASFLPNFAHPTARFSLSQHPPNCCFAAKQHFWVIS